MTTAYWRRKERLYPNCGLELGLEIGSFNPSHLQPIQELQSFITQRYENLEHCESQLQAVFDTFCFLVMGKDDPRMRMLPPKTKTIAETKIFGTSHWPKL